MGVVLLVRHGQASFGAADYDVLSDNGSQQSRLLGRSLAAHGLDLPEVVGPGAAPGSGAEAPPGGAGAPLQHHRAQHGARYHADLPGRDGAFRAPLPGPPAAGHAVLEHHPRAPATGAGASPEFLLCVALDEQGVPGGFLRVVPAYGPSFGYTLDLMRHDPAAPNGMTEFLIAGAAAALGQRGVRRLSMNFAMWGRLFADDIPFSPAQRAARWAVGVLNPFFQIKSLHDFNAKFDPEWLPRVLAYRHHIDLPRVGLLYAGAEGFLALPVIGELLVPKAVGGVTAPSAPANTAGTNAA